MNVWRIESGLSPSLQDIGVGKEIVARRQPVNYTTILGNNSRILFLGDDHQDFAIRDHLVRYAQGVRAAGITHYAIEAHADTPTKEAFAKLNQGEDVDLLAVNVCPIQTANVKMNYEAATRAIAALGIQIVPIDIKTKVREIRESTLAQNLLDILRVDSKARVAVLIGDGHTQRFELSFMMSALGVKPLGARVTKAGYQTVNVTYIGGDRAIDPVSWINSLARTENVAQEEFMLDTRSIKGLPLHPWVDADFIIHLPQNKISLEDRLSRLESVVK